LSGKINIDGKNQNMNTKLLMTSSSLFLGIIGIVLTFFPKEILEYLKIETDVITILFLQILGSFYLGFGLLNWMAKGSLIGGIYNKPIAVGNFMHFMVSAITLLKIVYSIQVHIEIIISLTIVYSVFAASFAYVFRTNPKSINNETRIMG